MVPNTVCLAFAYHFYGLLLLLHLDRHGRLASCLGSATSDTQSTAGHGISLAFHDVEMEETSLEFIQNPF